MRRPKHSSIKRMEPTFSGYISTVHEAMMIFDLVNRGTLPKIKRRLDESERNCIRSGDVFVFDEKESNMKRWTDGLAWTPSRILNEFLVYREVERECGPSDKAGSSNSTRLSCHDQSIQHLDSVFETRYDASQNQVDGADVHLASQHLALLMTENETYLSGRFRKGYHFKKGGLIKKTLSIEKADTMQHMISYYTMEDVLLGKLRSPASLSCFSPIPNGTSTLCQYPIDSSLKSEHVNNIQSFVNKNETCMIETEVNNSRGSQSAPPPSCRFPSTLPPYFREDSINQPMRQIHALNNENIAPAPFLQFTSIPGYRMPLQLHPELNSVPVIDLEALPFCGNNLEGNLSKEPLFTRQDLLYSPSQFSAIPMRRDSNDIIIKHCTDMIMRHSISNPPRQEHNYLHKSILWQQDSFPGLERTLQESLQTPQFENYLREITQFSINQADMIQAHRRASCSYRRQDQWSTTSLPRCSQ